MRDTIRTTIPYTSLLDKLLKKQGDLSDYKFAAMLHIPRTTWLGTKTGSRPIGITLLKAVKRTFPREFDEDILQFLCGDNSGD